MHEIAHNVPNQSSNVGGVGGDSIETTILRTKLWKCMACVFTCEAEFLVIQCKRVVHDWIEQKLNSRRSPPETEVFFLSLSCEAEEPRK